MPLTDMKNRSKIAEVRQMRENIKTEASQRRADRTNGTGGTSKANKWRVQINRTLRDSIMAAIKDDQKIDNVLFQNCLSNSLVPLNT